MTPPVRAPARSGIEPRAEVAQLAPAFGVYVHIPFCASRCPYCDFNTYVGIEDLAPAYVDALLVEARAWAHRAGRCSVGSVFLGGGTPSLLSPDLVGRLLDGLRAVFPISPGAEVTIEANPETVDRARLAAFRTAGVNRVSFGAQSFVPHVLAALGRAHSAERTREAVAAAREAGFANVNLDLIYGTPGESLDDWRRTLEEAIALSPEHVSAYALTIEPATAFGAAVVSGALPSPDEDAQADAYELALDLLAAADYEHYEISNWARPGAACRHNLMYWTQGDYAGIGAGAHGHLDGVRSWNRKLPRDYIEHATGPVAGEERLDRRTRDEEWLALRLRLVAGLDLAEAARRVGAGVRDRAREPTDRGLAFLQDDRLTLTRRGLLLESQVAMALTERF